MARITVDPGHGGRDPGARSAGGVLEKDLVLRYSISLVEELERRGHAVVLTRGTDTDLASNVRDWRVGKGIDLQTRCDISNRFRSHAFISMHANAGASRASNGAWVLYAKGSSRGQRLATEIFRRLARIRGIPDADLSAEVYTDESGWTGGRTLKVLHRTAAPAVLVELGFLTNAEDVQQLLHPETHALVTAAIADGLDAWLALKL